MANDPNFTIRLPKAVKKRVVELARAQDQTASDWVRAALDEWSASEPLSVDRERAAIAVRLDRKQQAKLKRLTRRAGVPLSAAMAMMVTKRLNAEAPTNERSAPPRPTPTKPRPRITRATSKRLSKAAKAAQAAAEELAEAISLAVDEAAKIEPTLDRGQAGTRSKRKRAITKRRR